MEDPRKKWVSTKITAREARVEQHVKWLFGSSLGVEDLELVTGQLKDKLGELKLLDSSYSLDLTKATIVSKRESWSWSVGARLLFGCESAIKKIKDLEGRDKGHVLILPTDFDCLTSSFNVSEK